MISALPIDHPASPPPPSLIISDFLWSWSSFSEVNVNEHFEMLIVSDFSMHLFRMGDFRARILTVFR